MVSQRPARGDETRVARPSEYAPPAERHGLKAVEGALADETERTIGDNSGDEAPMEPRPAAMSRDRAYGAHTSAVVDTMSAGTAEKIRMFRKAVDDMESYLIQDAASVKASIENHIRIGELIGAEVDRLTNAVAELKKGHEAVVKNGR